MLKFWHSQEVRTESNSGVKKIIIPRRCLAVKKTHSEQYKIIKQLWIFEDEDYSKPNETG